MAENLFFRKGTLAELESATIVPGAINFTTDEPAIYLDIDSSTRRRIGDLIIVERTSDLLSKEALLDTAPGGSKKNWSTQALYYIVQDNALMRWNGTSWTQLNSVSDITADLTNIKSDIVSLKTAAEDNTKAIAVNDEEIQSLQGAVASNTELINTTKTNLEESIGTKASQEDLKNAEDRISANEGKISTLETSVVNLTKTIGDNTTNISNNTTEINNLKSSKADKSYVDGELEKVNGAADELDQRITIAENSISSHATAIASKADASTVTALTERVAANETAIDTKANKSDVEGLTTRVDTAENDIEALEGRTTAIEGNVSTLQQGVENNKIAIEANQKAITDLDTKIAGDLAGAKKELQDQITANDTDIAANAESIIKANEDIATLQQGLVNTNTALGTTNSRIEEVNNEVLKQIRQHNAMTYKGAIAAYSELSTKTDVRIGDTWVASKEFIDADKAYFAGDLFIAGADDNEEDNEGHITGTVQWTHISTGYLESHESKLSLTAPSGVPQVKLTSRTEGDLGQFGIKSENENLKLSVKEVSGKPVLTFNLEWGSFIS